MKVGVIDGEGSTAFEASKEPNGTWDQDAVSLVYPALDGKMALQTQVEVDSPVLKWMASEQAHSLVRKAVVAGETDWVDIEYVHSIMMPEGVMMGTPARAPGLVAQYNRLLLFAISVGPEVEHREAAVDVAKGKDTAEAASDVGGAVDSEVSEADGEGIEVEEYSVELPATIQGTVLARHPQAKVFLLILAGTPNILAHLDDMATHASKGASYTRPFHGTMPLTYGVAQAVAASLGKVKSQAPIFKKKRHEELKTPLAADGTPSPARLTGEAALAARRASVKRRAGSPLKRKLASKASRR